MSVVFLRLELASLQDRQRRLAARVERRNSSSLGGKASWTFEWMAGEEALAAVKYKTKRGKKSDTGIVSPRKDSTTKPFRLENLNFDVPRGQLVAGD
jgi:hypothetical protein